MQQRPKHSITTIFSSRSAPTRAYQGGLTLVCPGASRGGWTPLPQTPLALTTRNPTSGRAPACSGTPAMAATTQTTAIARDFWQVTGLCVLSVECCAVITPNQSNLLREYTEFESNPPENRVQRLQQGCLIFLPSHRLVGEALIQNNPCGVPTLKNKQRQKEETVEWEPRI